MSGDPPIVGEQPPIGASVSRLNAEAERTHSPLRVCPGCHTWYDYAARTKPTGFCVNCRPDRWALGDRDGWLCHICGDPIDRTLRRLPNGYDPMAPIVEHVVSRANGGSEDASNLHVAHMACNSRKGNRPWVPPPGWTLGPNGPVPPSP